MIISDRVDELIDGLREGIQLMHVGERVKFWFPAETAFGDNFALLGSLFPEDILMVDVLLVDVESVSESAEKASATVEPYECDSGATGGECSGEAQFAIESPVLRDGEPMPGIYTCEVPRGGNWSPPLAWRNAPAGTKSFVLKMQRTDNAERPVNWLIYDLPRNVTSLATNFLAQEPAKSGATYLGPDRAYYSGPCPSESDKKHAFDLSVYALDIESVADEKELPWSAIAEKVEQHTLAKASLSTSLIHQQGRYDAERKVLRKLISPPESYF